MATTTKPVPTTALTLKEANLENAQTVANRAGKALATARQTISNISTISEIKNEGYVAFVNSANLPKEKGWYIVNHKLGTIKPMLFSVGQPIPKLTWQEKLDVSNHAVSAIREGKPVSLFADDEGIHLGTADSSNGMAVLAERRDEPKINLAGKPDGQHKSRLSRFLFGG